MKMSNEETSEYRQKSELELLKSMYDRDLKDLRLKKKGDKWQPLDLILHLKPLRGSSNFQVPYVTVDLHIECSEEYPNEPPKINLDNPRGMSNVTVSELNNSLILLAAKHTGEVVIYELASYVQEFLHKHNKAPKGSFYEEMVTRNLAREQVEREKEQLELARRNQDIMDEVQQRQEMLKLETKKRKEQRLSSENSNDSSDSRKRSVSGNRWFNTSFDLSDELICEHKSTTILEFSNNGCKAIERGCCINHSKRNCIIYSGMDQDSGQLFMVHEWKIPVNSEITHIQRQISSIEQELNYLVKHKHQNLVHYLNIRQDIVEEEKQIVVHILQEFVFGLSCDSLFLYENIPLEMDMLRHIAKGVLNALEFLHRNNIVHKDLTSSCVYLNKKGMVTVSNYSLDKRLFDLITQTHSSNYNRQTDIYKFGVLILSLIKGSEVDDSNFDIPSNLALDLQDFLDKCLAKDEKYRLTACQLLNHQFLKVPVRLSPQRNVEEKLFERNPSPDTEAADKMLQQTNLGGQSRVESEFERLNCLGKGAYGVVFKVQNKLDQRFYALKRIELNPKNKQLNRKIIREVKLLSRLNHENVVRYYYSWIESAEIKMDDNECLTPSVTPSTAPNPNKKEVLFNDSSMIEKLVPPIRDVEWSISYGNKSKGVENKSSSEDESSSDDDEDNWGLRFKSSSESSDSDYIEFVRDNELEASQTIDITESKATDTIDSKVSITKQIQFMYIQMEFCEKSTLKTAIDHDIYRDTDRVWRLFREIVEGLAYIHMQGMIHRDLKPMNIFLDSDDHVKIGDFGLATTNIILRPNDFQANSKSFTDYGSHEGGGDPSMTGHIGTALYVAPELTSTAKAAYNQKVDIYSLGIIFFEMSYKPLTTGMERIGVLNRLRFEESGFPPDFRVSACSKQEHVIRWLLTHDVSKRPTCQELLQSDHLPPPVYEDRELQELVRRTLHNSELKGYKYLVESCFQQPIISPAQDITYDNELAAANTVKNLQIYNCVKEAIIKVFYIHGGQHLSTPLLMPSSKFYDGVDTCVKLMTHSGSIVSIPHDLRVPFARYIAWNGITSLRRFAIERVYREKKIFGYVPRELYECAFDIVTPTPGNYMADAELLHILNEVVEQVPGFKNRNLQIRLNHILLLQAILIHCGIKDKHSELCQLLSDAREGKVTRSQVRTHLISKGLSNYHITTLFTLLECENTITKIVGALLTITKKKNSKASQLAKQALQELKIIIQNAEELGVNLNIVITPGLVHNIQQYSGMMCQLVCEVKKKHKTGIDVLAAGGRYDNMICSYRKMMVQATCSSTQSAVGISISLDKLVQAVDKEQISEITANSYLDVVVCSLGCSNLIKEKSKVLHELWSASIRCCLIDAVSLEDIQQQCNESHISHAVILKEHGVVKVVSWDRDRLQEVQLRTVELVDNLQRILRTSNDSCSEVNNALSRSESKTSRDSQEANVNIYFSEKLTVNSRKRIETQIRSQLDSVFKRLNGEVTLLGINLEGSVLSTMASCLNFESEILFNKSVEIVKEGHQKHKKNLSEICDLIYVQQMKKNHPIIILYSLKDGVYKVLL